MTLASIITPTLPSREALLIGRCIPSVQALAWDEVEHVIVSDANPGLAERIEAVPRRKGYAIRFVEINDTWRDGSHVMANGAVPWRLGSLMALGDYVGFLGDDDELLPDHVVRHVEALQNHHFSVSPVLFRAHGTDWNVIGDALAVGRLDATGIMCRRETLRSGNWPITTDNAPDFGMVAQWQARGLSGIVLGGAYTGIHNDGWLTGQTGK